MHLSQTPFIQTEGDWECRHPGQPLIIFLHSRATLVAGALGNAIGNCTWTLLRGGMHWVLHPIQRFHEVRGDVQCTLNNPIHPDSWLSPFIHPQVCSIRKLIPTGHLVSKSILAWQWWESVSGCGLLFLCVCFCANISVHCQVWMYLHIFWEFLCIKKII